MSKRSLPLDFLHAPMQTKRLRPTRMLGQQLAALRMRLEQVPTPFVSWSPADIALRDYALSLVGEPQHALLQPLPVGVDDIEEDSGRVMSELIGVLLARHASAQRARDMQTPPCSPRDNDPMDIVDI